jgi:Ras-related protein Rab-11A
VDEAKAFAESHHMSFIETSALDASNVSEAFRIMIETVHARNSTGLHGKEIGKMERMRNPSQGVAIPTGQERETEQKEKKSCC